MTSVNQGIDNRSRNFFQIDNIVMEIGLSAQQIALYAAITYYFNGKKGIAFPSIKSLAKRAGMSRRSVQTHMSTLENMGLIEIKRRKSEAGDNLSNIYVLNDLSNFSPQGSAADAPPSANTAHGSAAGARPHAADAGGVVQEMRTNNTNLEQYDITRLTNQKKDYAIEIAWDTPLAKTVLEAIASAGGLTSPKKQIAVSEISKPVKQGEKFAENTPPPGSAPPPSQNGAAEQAVSAGDEPTPKKARKLTDHQHMTGVIAQVIFEVDDPTKLVNGGSAGALSTLARKLFENQFGEYNREVCEYTVRKFVEWWDSTKKPRLVPKYKANFEPEFLAFLQLRDAKIREYLANGLPAQTPKAIVLESDERDRIYREHAEKVARGEVESAHDENGKYIPYYRRQLAKLEAAKQQEASNA